MARSARKRVYLLDSCSRANLSSKEEDEYYGCILNAIESSIEHDWFEKDLHLILFLNKLKQFSPDFEDDLTMLIGYALTRQKWKITDLLFDAYRHHFKLPPGKITDFLTDDFIMVYGEKIDDTMCQYLKTQLNINEACLSSKVFSRVSQESWRQINSLF